MNKIKIENIINIILDSATILFILIWEIIQKFDNDSFQLTTVILAILGVVNIIFIFIKEASAISYNAPKYFEIMFGFETIVAVIIYFIYTYIGGYDSFRLLYWIALIIGYIAPIIICMLLAHKAKNKPNNSNKPKFYVNK